MQRKRERERARFSSTASGFWSATELGCVPPISVCTSRCKLGESKFYIGASCAEQAWHLGPLSLPLGLSGAKARERTSWAGVKPHYSKSCRFPRLYPQKHLPCSTKVINWATCIWSGAVELNGHRLNKYSGHLDWLMSVACEGHACSIFSSMPKRASWLLRSMDCALCCYS